MPIVPIMYLIRLIKNWKKLLDQKKMCSDSANELINSFEPHTPRSIDSENASL